MSSSASSSVRNSLKRKLLSLFEGVKAERKLIVLDQHTVKIVDALCMMNELLDTGAYLVETIEKSRQPYPSMQAIYLLSPTKESIIRFIGDFSGRPKPAYKEAHLFISRELDTSLFNLIANSTAGSMVRTFQEIYIDVVGIESRAWHLGCSTGALARFMSPGLGSAETLSAYEEAASRITSMCASLCIWPIVRFHRSDMDKASPRLASLVHDQLKTYAGRNEFFAQNANTQAEFLILDRTFDLVAPLLHEFTYQAMAQDLLPIVQGSRYEFHTKAGGSEEVVRNVALDENDTLWTTMRHTHIAACSKLIIEKFNTFIQENKAAMKSNTSGKSKKSEGAVTSLGELREVMSSLGEFQEFKAQYSLHLTIAQECMNIFESKKLVDLANLEQDLATGLDSAGDPFVPKSVWPRLSTLLGSPQLDLQDKARLLALFLLTTPAIPDVERRALLERTQLAPESIEAIGAVMSMANGKTRAAIPVARKKEIEEAPFDVSRYTTQLKRIYREYLTNGLSAEAFPYVANPSTTGSISSGISRFAVSLRSRAADETTAQSSGQTLPASLNPGASLSEKPLFVFIIGGATYSEVRTAYEVSEKSKRDFFVGSTHMLTPEEYLHELSIYGKQM